MKNMLSPLTFKYVSQPEAPLILRRLEDTSPKPPIHTKQSQNGNQNSCPINGGVSKEKVVIVVETPRI